MRSNLKKGQYKAITLSADDVAKEVYKDYLGGGKEKWAARGAFQLYLLKSMGLRASHSVLDVGCGPIRGGVHLIRFLDEGKYYGIDSNEGFVTAAMQIVDNDPELGLKKPKLKYIENFDFSKIESAFDYVLAFSVLNHCNDQDIRLFFNRVDVVLRGNSRVYITHTRWFNQSLLAGSVLRLTRSFDCPNDISPALEMDRWGWDQDCGVFPVLELKQFQNAAGKGGVQPAP